MGVKFFGQFLIEQGEIDASHVREALELMEDTNPTLGELASSLMIRLISSSERNMSSQCWTPSRSSFRID